MIEWKMYDLSDSTRTSPLLLFATLHCVYMKRFMMLVSREGGISLFVEILQMIHLLNCGLMNEWKM